MSKGSGGTRKVTTRKPENFIVDASRRLYDSFGDDWIKTYFNDQNGGFLVTDVRRWEASLKTKQETAKYEKEKRMAETFASFGFQIEHLSEMPGISSSDVKLLGHPHSPSLVKINGQLADLKSTGSANNIYRYASHAIYSQGAELVLFEFTNKNRKIEDTIKELSRKGIHGYYYYTDDDKLLSY